MFQVKLTPVELGAMKEIIEQLEVCSLVSTKKKLLSKLVSFLSIMESIRGHGKIVNHKLISIIKHYEVEDDDILYTFTFQDLGE
jgi:hypothetical protein